jgi:hypothetical protein
MRVGLALGVLLLGVVAGCGSGSTRGAPGTVTADGGTRARATCVGALFAPRPTLEPIAAPLPPSVLRWFAIFRRRSSALDVPSASKLRGGDLVGELHEYELSRYYPSYVRRLLAGARVYVVPGLLSTHPMPAACRSLLPAKERFVLAEQQHRRLSEPVYCLIELGAGSAPAPGCEAFAANPLALRVFGASDFLRRPLVELVPDGVVSVRLTYRDRPALIVAVHDNVLAFRPPPPPRVLAGPLKATIPQLTGKAGAQQRAAVTRRWNGLIAETDPTRVEWLNRQGDAVHVATPPSPASYAASSVGDGIAPVEG